jgi:hypothetical protein
MMLVNGYEGRWCSEKIGRVELGSLECLLRLSNEGREGEMWSSLGRDLGRG